jgi:hypothetical protein
MATTKAKKQYSKRQLQRMAVLAFATRLLDQERATFCGTKAGLMYVGMIEGASAQLRALTPAPAVPVPPPSTEEVEQHTRLGNAIRCGLEFVVELPETEDEERETANRVIEVLGSKPLNERTRRETRFALAADVRQRVKGMAEAVARLPLAPGGRAFGDLIDRWCALGDRFGDQIATREVAADKKDNKAAGTATSKLVGLINRARAALRDEVAYDETLPRTLEQDLFGLYDALLAAQTPRKKPRKAGQAKPAPAPASPLPAPQSPPTP